MKPEMPHVPFWAIIILAIMLSPVLLSASPQEVDLNASDSAAKITRYPLIHNLSFTAGFDHVTSSAGDELREKIPPEDKISVNSSMPLSLRYSFSFTNPHISHYLPDGYQGIAIGVLNLGGLQNHGYTLSTHNIGYPVLTYIFQGGPFWHFTKDLSLDYEWNFGAAIGWKPYSEDNKYFNLTVGSQVNAYLNLNMSMKWQVNERLALSGGIGVSHFSNGNTSFPNPGVNSFGVKLGLIYTLNPQNHKPCNEVKEYQGEEDAVRKRKPEYDFLIWGASRKRVYKGGIEPVLLPGHYACAGLSFSPMVSLNKWWRVGGSFDIQYDQSAGRPKIKKNTESVQDNSEPSTKIMYPPSTSFWKRVSLGLSAHGELRMPIFAVNVGLGYNVLAPWENRGSYQNISLKTYLCKQFFINVGYQLRNFQQQSSLMLGLGITL